MKKIYLTPAIRIQAIDTEDILDNSVGGVPVFDDKNPSSDASILITDGTEVLGNKTSVWDEGE